MWVVRAGSSSHVVLDCQCVASVLLGLCLLVHPAQHTGISRGATQDTCMAMGLPPRLADRPPPVLADDQVAQRLCMCVWFVYRCLMLSCWMSTSCCLLARQQQHDCRSGATATAAAGWRRNSICSASVFVCKAASRRGLVRVRVAHTHLVSLTV